MIPVLYPPNETAFVNNGLGRLNDAISCDVEEVRNGLFELTMEYPITGIHYADIAISCLIFATPSDGKDPEPFRIYKISRPLNGRITVNAEHISYQLNYIPVLPFTADSCIQALQGLKTNAAENCPFNFFTDKEITGSWVNPEPASIRARLGGSDGSILERYKGEYEFRRYNVYLWTNRGSNNGVTIRYGKNLTDLKQEESIESTYTGILPFWTSREEDNDTVITLPERVLHSDNAELYPFQRTITVDFTDDFEEAPTVEELRAAGENYINNNNIGVPEVNLTVSFIALWQTNEYKALAALERVNLCDTVTVRFDALGVNATAQVIRTKYDVLQDRYTEIELGDAKSSLGDTIAKISQVTSETAVNAATSAFTADIARAIDVFRGAMGGHMIVNTNANGEPVELLFMDTDDAATAVNVMRFNNAGIAFSTNGYNGPFNSAWFIDGTFDASQINVIGLTASMINGGILKLGNVDNVSGVLEVYDQQNNLVGRMDRNGLKMYGPDGSYVQINQTVGFAGFDRNNNKVYWVDSNEFHQRKSVIEEEITLCNMMRFIPITLYDGGGNVTSEGIGLVSVASGS